MDLRWNKAFRLLTGLVLSGLLCSCGTKSPGSEDELNAALEHGDKVADQIDLLYEEQRTALEDAAEDLFDFRTAAGAEQELILEQNDKTGEYQWYDWNTYERRSIDLSEDLETLMNLLREDYAVKYMIIEERSLYFVISEDQLVYVAEGGTPPRDHDIPLNDHWYHIWFEYGI